jgi:hypothetical protein
LVPIRFSLQLKKSPLFAPENIQAELSRKGNAFSQLNQRSKAEERLMKLFLRFFHQTSNIAASTKSFIQQEWRPIKSQFLQRPGSSLAIMAAHTWRKASFIWRRALRWRAIWSNENVCSPGPRPHLFKSAFYPTNQKATSIFSLSFAKGSSHWWHIFASASHLSISSIIFVRANGPFQKKGTTDFLP